MNFLPMRQFMDWLAQNHTPGCAIRVYFGGKQVFSYSAGWQDVEKRIPFSGNELFNLYSCSKVATVTAGVQLIERGVMKLSDPLYAYIPEFREMYVRRRDGGIEKAERDITIENLFTMTAGFDYNLEAPGFRKARAATNGKMDTVEVMRHVASDPLWFHPGSRWQYSICHDVLAAVISVASGMKFRDYMRENVFAPLDMQSTCYHHTPETLPQTAEQYVMIANSYPEYDPEEAKRSPQNPRGYIRNWGKGVSYILGEEYDSGGAGVISSADDYAKFAAALANMGMGLNGERILKPESVELLRTNRLTPELSAGFGWEQYRGCGYGLGVRVHMDPKVSGVNCPVGEFGWSGAAGATLIADPETGLGVFFAQHCLNPGEEDYLPALRRTLYNCL